MIVLLGATGYIGQAFAEELRRRNLEFIAPTRKELDYTRFDALSALLRERKPEFLINAAGYTGKPNVDACETARADTLQGNTLFPQTIAHVCATLNVPWGHISSGCIFAGAHVTEGGVERIETDLTQPRLRDHFLKSPKAFRGFNEADEPNFSFRKPPCSFYSGTKALGEEAIRDVGRNYIWRLRIPFDEVDNPRNYLSKIQNYAKVYDNINSLSHRADFASACIDLWQRRASFGIYNVTNPGAVATSEVVQMIERILKPGRSFAFWENDEEFYRVAARTPRSNCIMDVSKLLATGVKVRPVHEALEASLQNWSGKTR
jgi:dTDP-4-dehydrorhamnose reductase